MSRQFKVARRMNHLKLNEAADKLGVSQPTLSSWESGRKTPTVDNLIKMADLYGVTTDFLLGRNNSKPLKQEGPISYQNLPAMHGNPVWSEKYGWMIVDAVSNQLIIDYETSISFADAGELFATLPAFSYTTAPVKTPIEHSDLQQFKEIWVEPISTDTHLKNELRGWYRVKDRFVENEFGNRFYLDTYGAKWLAFIDFTDS